MLQSPTITAKIHYFIQDWKWFSHLCLLWLYSAWVLPWRTTFPCWIPGYSEQSQYSEDRINPRFLPFCRWLCALYHIPSLTSDCIHSCSGQTHVPWGCPASLHPEAHILHISVLPQGFLQSLRRVQEESGSNGEMKPSRQSSLQGKGTKQQINAHLQLGGILYIPLRSAFLMAISVKHLSLVFLDFPLHSPHSLTLASWNPVQNKSASCKSSSPSLLPGVQRHGYFKLFRIMSWCSGIVLR